MALLDCNRKRPCLQLGLCCLCVFLQFLHTARACHTTYCKPPSPPPPPPPPPPATQPPTTTSTTPPTTEPPCQWTPTTLSSHIGYPNLTDCTETQGSAVLCSIQCISSSSCKAVFVSSCDQPERCTCSYCNKLTGVDFSINDSPFFLLTQVIGTNTNDVYFPGSRLYFGQVLLADIFIKGTRIALHFLSPAGHSAFYTEIRFDESKVVSNSYIENQYGTEDLSTPHFNFQQNQTISMFCIITQASYHLYLDKVLFKVFPFRWPIDDVSHFRVADSESYIISFST